MKFILVADDDTVSQTFFPLWEAGGFVLIVAVLLFVLFPRHLLDNVVTTKDPSIISIGYLQAFSTTYPDNNELLMALTTQQASLGEINLAKQNFAMLKKINATSTNPQTALQLDWINYEILKYTSYKAPLREREKLLVTLRNMTKTLAAAPLDVQQLKILAMDSLAYNRADIALQIYQQLLNKNELQTPAEFAMGGNIAMQNNAHQASAAFYRTAYEKSATIADKRKYALDVMRVLWSGNLLEQAYQFAITLPDAVIDDQGMLIYISKVCMAANHPEVAQKYALKALLYEAQRKHE
jgi:hypothetical protein